MNQLSSTIPPSPKSPVSPTPQSAGYGPTESPFTKAFKEAAHESEIRRVLKRIGYSQGEKVADTLQGTIWRATQLLPDSTISNNTTVFKITDIGLHHTSLGMVDGRKYSVHENICLEQSILKYLTQQLDCPKSIVKWHAFFKTNTDYWLCMEDGGMSLFDFIQTSHQFILKGKLSIQEWQRVVQIIFKQMIECVEFMHRHNVCHNDVSLENFLINDVELTVDRNENVTFSGNIQIKLCDLGLAVLHTSEDCLSNRHCGKTHYKSPEVMNRNKWFNAKANEIWCLGVCLFAMSTGCRPWSKATDDEDSFIYIMSGSLVDLLQIWGIRDYVEPELIMFLQSIFQLEDKRITIRDMKRHAWMNTSAM